MIFIVFKLCFKCMSEIVILKEMEHFAPQNEVVENI